MDAYNQVLGYCLSYNYASQRLMYKIGLKPNIAKNSNGNPKLYILLFRKK